MRWTVPPMWAGRTVAILASGPSMSTEVAQQVHRAGIHAIALNTTHRLAPWADMLYAADPEWWLHPDNRAAHGFAGLRVSIDSQVPGVLSLGKTGTRGFDPDPRQLRTGGNSAYQALHIAAHAGAARVLLCGLDLRDLDGRKHWHGRHPTGLRETPPEQYRIWCERFAELEPVLADRGMDVVNVTPGSALTCFRTSTLARELETEACAAP